MTAQIDFTLPRLNTVRCGPRGGTPVVLIHAVGLDLSYWDRQIAALSTGQDVVAWDLPGHGRSPGAPEDWTLEHATAVLGDLIYMIDRHGAHVVGLSVGGMIAQALAIERPELVRSLTLIDTAASFPEDARLGMRARAHAVRARGMSAVLQTTLERWFTPQTMAARPDILDRVTKTLLRDDALIHAAMWDMISTLDLVGQLHRISCPTLILVGEHDPSSPPSAAKTLKENIASSTLHVIANAAHLSPLERPEVINRYVLDFLSHQNRG